MQQASKTRWDWLASGILLALVLTSAIRLAATKWTEHLALGETMALLGAFLGLALGVSRFSPRTVRWMAFAYSILLIPAQLASLAQSYLPFREKLAEVGMRFNAAFLTFTRGQPVDDPILFIAFIVTAFWVVGVVSGHGLTRHRSALAAILPSALAILIVQVYDPIPRAGMWQVALYLTFTLLLIGRLYFLENREAWQARRIPQLPEIQSDLTNDLAIAAVFVVLVAWNLPLSISKLNEAAVMWKNLTRPFDSLREDVERAFDPLEPSYGLRGRADFYAENLPLGRGLPLSNNPMFSVRVPLDIVKPPPRYYWRARVFSDYDGTQWRNPDAIRDEFETRVTSLPVPDLAEREVVQFEVHNAHEQFMLYAPSQPIWVSLPGEMLIQRTPDNTLDLISLRSDTLVRRNDIYLVRSALVSPSVEQLRSAGTDYPLWVVSRYLQLPQNFSPRIAQLANEIAADQSTPYDQAQAVTLWLRDNLDYEPVIPAPPQGTNALEWVLFEYKRGFCMYYATSEILMLRSLGIPARMAVGFAEGEFDDLTSTYSVSQSDYHAWPEVYFPGYGWVEFEPTVSQSEILRPLGSTADNGAPSDVSPLPTPTPLPEVVGPVIGENATGVALSDPWYVTWRGVIISAVVVLFILLLWVTNRATGWMERIPRALEARAERRGIPASNWIRVWAAWTRLSPVARSFETVNLSLRMLGDPQPAHATPGERAERLSLLIPEAQDSLQALITHHELSLYAGLESNVADARRQARLILSAAMRARLLQLGRSLNERLAQPDH